MPPGGVHLIAYVLCLAWLCMILERMIYVCLARPTKLKTDGLGQRRRPRLPRPPGSLRDEAGQVEQGFGHETLKTGVGISVALPIENGGDDAHEGSIAASAR